MSKFNSTQIGQGIANSRFMSSAELARAEFPQSWLIEGILVRGQPGVIGGAIKSMKTSIGVDMAISLGSGTRFLNQFKVPESRRVAVMSGESGAATLKEAALRICASKQIELEDCDVLWSHRLPSLTSGQDRMALRRFLRESEIEVVILDPLYLLLSGQEVAASNLYEMGNLLHRVGRMCLCAGATPVFIHHSTKNATRAKYQGTSEPPALSDLAFSGIAEYVRQWVLLGRRNPYQEGTGHHELSMTVGGSAGHSGRWDVDIDEGVTNRKLKGRTWKVGCRSPNLTTRRSSDRLKTGFDNG